MGYGSLCLWFLMAGAKQSTKWLNWWQRYIHKFYENDWMWEIKFYRKSLPEGSPLQTCLPRGSPKMRLISGRMLLENAPGNNVPFRMDSHSPCEEEGKREQRQIWVLFGYLGYSQSWACMERNLKGWRRYRLTSSECPRAVVNFDLYQTVMKYRFPTSTCKTPPFPGWSWEPAKIAEPNSCTWCSIASRLHAAATYTIDDDAQS